MSATRPSPLVLVMKAQGGGNTGAREEQHAAPNFRTQKSRCGGPHRLSVVRSSDGVGLLARGVFVDVCGSLVLHRRCLGPPLRLSVFENAVSLFLAQIAERDELLEGIWTVP